MEVFIHNINVLIKMTKSTNYKTYLIFNQYLELYNVPIQIANRYLLHFGDRFDVRHSLHQFQCHYYVDPSLCINSRS